MRNANFRTAPWVFASSLLALPTRILRALHAHLNIETPSAVLETLPHNKRLKLTGHSQLQATVVASVIEIKRFQRSGHPAGSLTADPLGGVDLEPGTLSTFAEVGIALAGFSGVVVALGRRAVGEWIRWIDFAPSPS